MSERSLEVSVCFSFFALSGNYISVIPMEVFWDYKLKIVSTTGIIFICYYSWIELGVSVSSMYESLNPSFGTYSMTLTLGKSLSLSVANL